MGLPLRAYRNVRYVEVAVLSRNRHHLIVHWTRLFHTFAVLVTRFVGRLAAAATAAAAGQAVRPSGQHDSDRVRHEADDHDGDDDDEAAVDGRIGERGHASSLEERDDIIHEPDDEECS